MNTQTTYGGYAGVQGLSRGRGIVAAIKHSARRVMQSMMARHIERETARELANLPTYILRDIGVQPEDIRRIAADLARERADAWARRAGASNGFGG